MTAHACQRRRSKVTMRTPVVEAIHRTVGSEAEGQHKRRLARGRLVTGG